MLYGQFSLFNNMTLGGESVAFRHLFYVIDTNGSRTEETFIMIFFNPRSCTVYIFFWVIDWNVYKQHTYASIRSCDLSFISIPVAPLVISLPQRLWNNYQNMVKSPIHKQNTTRHESCAEFSGYTVNIHLWTYQGVGSFDTPGLNAQRFK